jgi:hypothetical protein
MNKFAHRALLLSVGVACLMPMAASALIMVGRGNDPVHDAGWPQGALDVANLKSRVGWWEGPPFGGGQWQFLYRGDTAAFSEALAKFAAIRAPSLDLVIRDGPEENNFLKDSNKTNSETRVDWAFTAWVPANWHRLFNNPKSVFDSDHPNFRQPVDPPRLDVYLGGGGQLDWTKVKVPASVRVRDERASAAGVDPVGGAMVRADVFDMATGKPIRGARAIVARMSGGGQNPRTDYETVTESVSDDAGRLQVEKIPPGTHRVSVSAPGYAARLLGYERYGDRTYKHLAVELAKAAPLSGVVTDTDGKAINNVKVRASSVMAMDGRGYSGLDPREIATDEKGRFELAGLPEGFTQLHATAPGYYFGDLFTIHDVPSTNIVLRLSRAGGIQVSVFDRNGKALTRFEGSEVLVEVEPKGGHRIGTWGGSGMVNAEGILEFKDMPPGEYRVTSRPNPSTTSRQYVPDQMVTVSPGARVNVKLVYE